MAVCFSRNETISYLAGEIKRAFLAIPIDIKFFGFMSFTDDW